MKESSASRSGDKTYGSLPFFCEVILNKKDHMQLNIFPPKLLWFPSHIHLLQNFVKITIDKWLTPQFGKGCSNAVFLKTNVKDRHRKTIEALQQIHTNVEHMRVPDHLPHVAHPEHEKVGQMSIEVPMYSWER